MRPPCCGRSSPRARASTWSSAGPRGSRCSTRRGSPSGTRTGGTTCGHGSRAGADGKPGAFDVDVSGDRVRHWAAGDLAAGPSSGSYPVRGMLIVPASTACVAGVSLGLSKDLLQRAASVTLKERRPLVVAVRETPLNGQTLRHLVALDDAGASVVPASPALLRGSHPHPGPGGLRRRAGARRGGGRARALPPLGGRAGRRFRPPNPGIDADRRQSTSQYLVSSDH